jgi:hypothetical protein
LDNNLNIDIRSRCSALLAGTMRVQSNNSLWLPKRTNFNSVALWM